MFMWVFIFFVVCFGVTRGAAQLWPEIFPAGDSATPLVIGIVAGLLAVGALAMVSKWSHRRYYERKGYVPEELSVVDEGDSRREMYLLQIAVYAAIMGLAYAYDPNFRTKLGAVSLMGVGGAWLVTQIVAAIQRTIARDRAGLPIFAPGFTPRMYAVVFVTYVAIMGSNALFGWSRSGSVYLWPPCLLLGWLHKSLKQVLEKVL